MRVGNNEELLNDKLVVKKLQAGRQKLEKTGDDTVANPWLKTKACEPVAA